MTVQDYRQFFEAKCSSWSAETVRLQEVHDEIIANIEHLNSRPADEFEIQSIALDIIAAFIKERAQVKGTDGRAYYDSACRQLLISLKWDE